MVAVQLPAGKCIVSSVLVNSFSECDVADESEVVEARTVRSCPRDLEVLGGSQQVPEFDRCAMIPRYNKVNASARIVRLTCSRLESKLQSCIRTKQPLPGTMTMIVLGYVFPRLYYIPTFLHLHPFGRAIAITYSSNEENK
jgi:hypothetical protein